MNYLRVRTEVTEEAISNLNHQHLDGTFIKLWEQREWRVKKRHLMPGQVHMMLSTPPQCATPQVVEFIMSK
jgi:REP element-mobilizing transposase RayT